MVKKVTNINLEGRKMYRLSIIEESLNDNKVLNKMKPYFYSQRIENVPEDDCPVWHTNEYHIEDDEIRAVLSFLQNKVLPTWYIHAFNDKKLYVVLCGKFFELPLYRDEKWNEMIEYGVKYAQVERSYLENVPLHI